MERKFLISSSVGIDCGKLMSLSLALAPTISHGYERRLLKSCWTSLAFVVSFRSYLSGSLKESIDQKRPSLGMRHSNESRRILVAVVKNALHVKKGRNSKHREHKIEAKIDKKN